MGTSEGPIDPLLGPLQDNGGPTETHALLLGSPAIDAGSCEDADGNPVASDQRGIARPQGRACDIGAFESEPLPSGQIAGTATLQGQVDHSGITILLDGPEPLSLTTDATGSFITGAIEPGSYTVRAEHPYYLPAETTVEIIEDQVVSLEVVLRAGDVNNDGVIDAMDLALTGGNIGHTESQWLARE